MVDRYARAVEGQGDVPVLAEAPRLPAGRARACFYALATLVHLLLSAAVAVLAAPGHRGVVIAVAALEPLLIVLVSLLLRPLRARTIRRRMGRGHATRLSAPSLAEALAGCGVSRLEVYRQNAGRAVLGRAYRLGRHGVIVLSAATLRYRQVARFVVAHEAGHLARRDSQRVRLGHGFATALASAGLLSGRGTVFGVCVLVAVPVVTAIRWSTELGSDRTAVRWVGGSAAMAWYQFHARLRGAEPRTPRRSLRRGAAWLSHPPMALRKALWSRVDRGHTARFPAPDPSQPDAAGSLRPGTGS